MELQRLEIQNCRSVKDQWGENAIEFEGLDCLVGKNNAGKTNIISCVKYLLEKEDKDNDDELYWNKDTSLTVEVRGFFKVTEADLERIQDEDKREAVRELLQDEEKFELDNHLGICRITGPEDEGGFTQFKLIQPRPTDDRYDEETFVQFRDGQWDRIGDEDGFTNTNYRDEMQEEYPNVAEHVDEDSLTQKGAWKDGYERYIESRPEDLEFELQPTDFPPGTKQVIRNALLPEVIKIPAIKEVEDATRASGELGELTDALSDEIQDEIDEQIHEELEEIYSRLDTDSQDLETRISDYLKEAFKDYSIELDFPRMESRQLFRDAQIRINDDILESDTLSTENVGEGVRRVLIFSMLRTIADLRDGSLSIAKGDDDEDGGEQPLIILYEEAELFLHPNLQKILLRVFSSLTTGDAQIIFNTHSPVLVQNQILDTINIVRKNQEKGSKVTQFHTVLNDREPGERSRLMDLQKVSSYIFSDKVILVEGRSDELILRKLAPKLDSEWEFESNEIPILPVEGKGNFPLFKDFLEELGMDAFVVADIGALRRTIPGILDDEELVEEIERVKDTAASLVEAGEVEQRWTKSDISKLINRASWEKTFDRLKELEERLEDGEEVKEEHIESVKKLTNKRSKDAWREAITSDHERINSARLELRDRLLGVGILVLQGEIEDYYPDVDVGHKIEAALEFSADDYDNDELRGYFVELPSRGRTDVEVFFTKVFQSE
ncbi:AAA family ATPase [Halorarius litoreus]|uniref:AAA family ATPase n=1 Tax=Halorarius litoreus TaxID=2962676 RepID=UPI0020CE5543|nr:AAA family ATPase [Halorarius litoreus]